MFSCLVPQMMSYNMETSTNPVFLNPVKPYYNNVDAI